MTHLPVASWVWSRWKKAEAFGQSHYYECPLNSNVVLADFFRIKEDLTWEIWSLHKSVCQHNQSCPLLSSSSGAVTRVSSHVLRCQEDRECGIAIREYIALAPDQGRKIQRQIDSFRGFWPPTVMAQAATYRLVAIQELTIKVSEPTTVRGETPPCDVPEVIRHRRMNIRVRVYCGTRTSMTACCVNQKYNARGVNSLAYKGCLRIYLQLW